jgi:CheY-like chemotaxis protein
MLKSAITDGTSTLFITLWENEIDSVLDSKVYIIDDVKVNFSYVAKALTTTQKSVFSLVDGDDMEEVNDSVALQMLEEPSETTLLVSSIRSVEVSKYHTCIHCNKKLPQGLRTKIVKCMRCPRRMRLPDCNVDVSCQIYVEVDDSETQLTVFSDVLGNLLAQSNVSDLTEEEISEQLLELNDIQITFKNDDSIVTSCVV